MAKIKLVPSKISEKDIISAAHANEFDDLCEWTNDDTIRNILLAYVDSKYYPAAYNRVTRIATVRNLEELQKFYADSAKEVGRVLRKFKRRYT